MQSVSISQLKFVSSLSGKTFALNSKVAQPFSTNFSAVLDLTHIGE